MFRPTTSCWRCASTKAISTSTCRCRRACAPKSCRTARCSGCRARCSRMRAPSSITPASTTDMKIDRADVRFNWDARQRALIIPFQVQSGGNQFTMRAALEAPADQSGVWLFSMARGDPVIDPIILGVGRESRRGELRAQPGGGARAHRHGAPSHRSRSRRLQPRRYAAARTMSASRSPAASIIRGSRAASGVRRRRHAHADGGDEAVVAAVHRHRCARMGR